MTSVVVIHGDDGIVVRVMAVLMSVVKVMPTMMVVLTLFMAPLT